MSLSAVSTLHLRALAVASLLSACMINWGRWSPGAFGFYVAALALWFASFLGKGSSGLGDSRTAAMTTLVLLAALQVLALVHDPTVVIYRQSPTLAPWRFTEALALTGSAFLLALTATRRDTAERRDALFGALLALGLVGRVCAIVASPAPRMDVWAAHQSAVHDLLSGADPYTRPVPDVYGGSAPSLYGAQLERYPYPPLNLFVIAPFVLLFGDARYALVTVELIGIAVLWWRALRAHPMRGAFEGLLLLYYLEPMAPFGIEQAWTEPLAAGGLCLLLALTLVRPTTDRWLGVVVGLVVALKQHFFVLLNLSVLGRRPRRVAMTALVVVAITLAPFLLIHPTEVTRALVELVGNPFRLSNLSLNQAFEHAFGSHVAPPVTLVVIGLLGFIPK